MNQAKQKKTTTRMDLSQKRKSLANWGFYQQLAFKLSINRLKQTPWSSFMTLFIIAIVLLFPCLLYVLLTNINQASVSLDKGTQFTIYLKKDVSDDKAQDIVKQIKLNSAIKSVRYISPLQGLNEFAKNEGFLDVLDELPQNPLPGVIVAEPKVNLGDRNQFLNLFHRLQSLPQADAVRFDFAWLNRLNAFLKLANKGLIIITILLALSVIVIIGNSLRMMVQKYWNEIEVMKLVGATNAFVRRPFVYSGFLLGFLGACFSLFFLGFILILLTKPVQAIADSYQTNFKLHGFSILQMLEFIFLSGVLGLVSAYIAVSRQIKRIEPGN